MSYSQIPRDYPQPVNLNPGQELKSFFESMYSDTDTDYLYKIDNDLICDKQLINLTYNGAINYALRRLISSSHFIYKKYEKNGEGRVRVELRKYLSSYTRFDEEHFSRIVNYLLECIKNSNDDFNDKDKRVATRQIKEFDWGCYICGREMDLAKNNGDFSYKWATADHKWPRLLGGNSDSENLRYACQDCNSKYKKDFLDYNDYHFKEIALLITNYENYLDHSRSRAYEAAVFAKTDYRCSVCSQPAYRIGELHMGRIDLNDSWHYLNLTPYCYMHKPE